MKTVPANRYAQAFEALSASEKKAFIPFTLLGWPEVETSFALIQAMIDSGATALELGFPFSDPVSDGPVIQQAAHQALAAGFRVNAGLALLTRVRALNPHLPIGVMVYYNMVLARGAARFLMELAEAGVDGLLIVDATAEVAEEIAPLAKQAGLQLIYIVSPLTNAPRLETILQYAGGFLYIVSRLGITGTEERYDADLAMLLARVKAQTTLPLCVGFGISTPEQARRITALGADGVITGSRIIQLVSDTPPTDRMAALKRYCTDMGQAVG